MNPINLNKHLYVGMNSKVWQNEIEFHRKVERVFFEVCELSPEEQRNVLNDLTDGDMKLRSTVAGMLQRDQEVDPFFDNNARIPDSAAFGLLEVGSIVDSWEIVRLLGEGGMGAVYLARKRGPVCNEVALKVVASGLDSKGVISRFEAERQVLAMFDHPNLTRIFDGGITEHGLPYFVMEYVPGESVTSYCRNNSVGLEGRLQMFVEICDAIHHAHQKGVIHRDIKPSNIMVTQIDGKPVAKVIDFGTAKCLEGQTLAVKNGLTIVGEVIGTPLYMSPEQAESGSIAVDVRSDIYSLGVLLYELITGTTPLRGSDITGANCLKTLEAIRDLKAALPSERVATVDDLGSILGYETTKKLHSKTLRGDLDLVVAKAIAKDLDFRYETVAEFRKDVSNFLNGDPVSAVAPSVRYRMGKFIRKHPIPTAITALLSLGVLVFALIAVNQAVQNSRALDENRLLVIQLRQQSSSLGKALGRAELAEVSQRELLRTKKYQFAFERAITAFDREQQKVLAELNPWLQPGAEESVNQISASMLEESRLESIPDETLHENLDSVMAGMADEATFSEPQMHQDANDVFPSASSLPMMMNGPDLATSRFLMEQHTLESLGLSCLLPSAIQRETLVPLVFDDRFGWSEYGTRNEFTSTALRFCELLLSELNEEFDEHEEYVGIVKCVQAQIELTCGDSEAAMNSILDCQIVFEHSHRKDLELFAKTITWQIHFLEGDRAVARNLKLELLKRIENEIEDPNQQVQIVNMLQPTCVISFDPMSQSSVWALDCLFYLSWFFKESFEIEER